MKLVVFLMFFVLSACGQPNEKMQRINPRAKKLNDSATLIAIQQQDYAKAISLLDQATQIDSNYFTAYRNKLGFELGLRHYDDAVKIAFKILQLRPNNPDNYFTVGLLHNIQGDSLTSMKYFNEAANQYDKILDTMAPSNRNYDMLLMNKAINLIFIGEQQKGNDILKQLYTKQTEPAFKEFLGAYINKSKQDIINTWMKESTVEVEAQPN